MERERKQQKKRKGEQYRKGPQAGTQNLGHPRHGCPQGYGFDLLSNGKLIEEIIFAV